jgi:pyridoxamine 5'-phosphate oxidase
MNPIEIFLDWYRDEANKTKVRIPSACCLSTTGLDGYPNARFVSLKEVIDDKFIFTGCLSARKGIEIESTNKVALTFWWPVTERQIRVQGNAAKLSRALADRYFMERERDSQIVSLVSEQGKSIEEPKLLEDRFQENETLYTDKKISRPPNWGGYAVEPVRIEFLEFKESRFHKRTLYTCINKNWTSVYLQP